MVGCFFFPGVINITAGAFCILYDGGLRTYVGACCAETACARYYCSWLSTGASTEQSGLSPLIGTLAGGHG